MDAYHQRVLQAAIGLLKKAKAGVDKPLWRELQRVGLEGRGRLWDESVLIPGWLVGMVLGLPSDTYSLFLRVATPALAAWDLTKGVYLFDPDLFEALLSTPLGRLPVELIRRLPEWAPFLLFPKPWEGAAGAWIYLNHDLRGVPHLEFRAVLLREDGHFLPVGLDLAREDFEACLEATKEEAVHCAKAFFGSTEEGSAQSFQTFLKRWFPGLLSLALYLASEEPDFSGPPPPPPQPRPGRPPLRAERLGVVEVGWRIGEALRKGRTSLGNTEGRGPARVGRPKAPHIRRGHWHLYWTGKGRTVPRVRWVHPVLVGAKWLDLELPAVVRPVRGDGEGLEA